MPGQSPSPGGTGQARPRPAARDWTGGPKKTATKGCLGGRWDCLRGYEATLCAWRLICLLTTRPAVLDRSPEPRRVPRMYCPAKVHGTGVSPGSLGAKGAVLPQRGAFLALGLRCENGSMSRLTCLLFSLSLPLLRSEERRV